VWEPRPGTDFHEVSDGWISITPMVLDFTEERALGELAEWKLEK